MEQTRFAQNLKPQHQGPPFLVALGVLPRMLFVAKAIVRREAGGYS
jgi:hypothetical protein